MEKLPQTLREAVEADMARLKIEQADLGRDVGVSQQSVSKWLAANHIPAGRVAQVLQVLGGQSATAGYMHRQAERAARNIAAHLIVQEPGPAAHYARQPGPTATAMGLLPEHLQDFVTAGFPDYSSPRLALEVKAPARAETALAAVGEALVKMAALRAESAGAERMHVVALLLPHDSPVPVSTWQRVHALAADAVKLGVSLIVCAHPAQLASTIIDVEAGRSTTEGLGNGAPE